MKHLVATHHLLTLFEWVIYVNETHQIIPKEV